MQQFGVGELDRARRRSRRSLSSYSKSTWTDASSRMTTPPRRRPRPTGNLNRVRFLSHLRDGGDRPFEGTTFGELRTLPQDDRPAPRLVLVLNLSCIEVLTAHRSQSRITERQAPIPAASFTLYASFVWSNRQT